MLFRKSDGLSAGLPNSITMINRCQSTFQNDMLVYLIAVVNSQQRFLKNSGEMESDNAEVPGARGSTCVCTGAWATGSTTELGLPAARTPQRPRASAASRRCPPSRPWGRSPAKAARWQTRGDAAGRGSGAGCRGPPARGFGACRGCAQQQEFSHPGERLAHLVGCELHVEFCNVFVL